MNIRVLSYHTLSYTHHQESNKHSPHKESIRSLQSRHSFPPQLQHTSLSQPPAKKCWGYSPVFKGGGNKSGYDKRLSSLNDLKLTEHSSKQSRRVTNWLKCLRRLDLGHPWGLFSLAPTFNTHPSAPIDWTRIRSAASIKQWMKRYPMFRCTVEDFRPIRFYSQWSCCRWTLC